MNQGTKKQTNKGNHNKKEGVKKSRTPIKKAIAIAATSKTNNTRNNNNKHNNKEKQHKKKGGTPRNISQQKPEQEQQ